MNIKYLIIALCTLLFVSCNKKETPVNFYYWKSQVSIGETEKKYFEALESKTLYIRVFDIDNETGQPLPKSKINKFDTSILSAQYVPVVFITNRTFTNISTDEVTRLAEKTYLLINEITVANGIKEYSEIQIDCDWTDKSRNNYFTFLKKLKHLSNKDISSTIRLHQIKYKKTTGVPPIDKGYLMCYATTNPSEGDGKNSILDMNLLKDYLATVNDYPIHLDIALPIYSWAVVTNHMGKIKLINGVTTSDLDSLNVEKIADNIYRLQDDLFFKGIYLNKDFTLRLEEITPDLLNEAKTYLHNHIKHNYAIVYYHLDAQFLNRYTIDNLK